MHKGYKWNKSFEYYNFLQNNRVVHLIPMEFTEISELEHLVRGTYTGRRSMYQRGYIPAFEQTLAATSVLPLEPSLKNGNSKGPIRRGDDPILDG